MQLAIACVGKLREGYFQDAAAEYLKRLTRFGGCTILECPDLSEPKNASAADITRIMDAEGAALLSKLGPRDHVIALTIDGKRLTSPGLSQRLVALGNESTHRVVFVIGGSNGLSSAVVARANERLSLSDMTFPHQLARVMLLEQLYRSNKILAGESYHK